MSNVILKLGYKLYVHTPFGPHFFRNELKRARDEFEDGFHSNITVLKYGFVNVTIIPYSLNNYGFIIWHQFQLGCIIIDPGYATPFQNYLIQNKLIPKMILVTHKHHDHAYGVKELIDLYPNVQIVGSVADRLRFTTNLISKEKEAFDFQFSLKEGEIEPSLSIAALLTPGHTVGHVIYLLSTKNEDINENYTLCFTGDTIFMGCVGRMFECKASVYFQSIQFFLESLLDMKCPIKNILLFPAHEYSVVNLRFITENLNSNNTDATKKLDWCQNKRESNDPTIPCGIMEELSFNPFFEVVLSDNKELQSKLNQLFAVELNVLSSENILMLYAFSISVRKSLQNLKSLSSLPIKLFKEIRQMRDAVNFKE